MEIRLIYWPLELSQSVGSTKAECSASENMHKKNKQKKKNPLLTVHFAVKHQKYRMPETLIVYLYKPDYAFSIFSYQFTLGQWLWQIRCSALFPASATKALRICRGEIIREAITRHFQNQLRLPYRCSPTSSAEFKLLKTGSETEGTCLSPKCFIKQIIRRCCTGEGMRGGGRKLELSAGTDKRSWCVVRWTHNLVKADQKGRAERERERRRVCHAQHGAFSSPVVN